MTKKVSIFNIIKVVFLSLCVFIIGLNYISIKENMTIDEFYTYGLSNNTFQLDIEDYKSYTGEELLNKYAAVKEGHEFDVANVVFNQTMDTHPPLYYMLVNFICSLNTGKFSMYFGLIINVIFLVVVFWEMRHLFYLVIGDKINATFLSLLSFFTYGFANEISFTRMYVMLTAVSLAFAILILEKIKTLKNESTMKEDVVFLIKFLLICICGILTQYHFMFMAAAFSLIFAFNLIKYKKIKLLLMTGLTGILSILISYLLFPGMIHHIFGSEGSLHSIAGEYQGSTIIETCISLFKTLYDSFFGKGLIVYIIIFVILVFLYVLTIIKKKNKITAKEIFNETYIYIVISSVFYFLLVAFTIKFIFARYLYNIYPFIVIILFSPIYFLLKNIKKGLSYFTLALLFTLCFTSMITKSPTNLCIGDSLLEDYLYNFRDAKTLLIYNSRGESGTPDDMAHTSLWKLPYVLYEFRYMNDMTFVDMANPDELKTSKNEAIQNNEDIILVIYTTQNDNEIISTIASRNGTPYTSKIFASNYVHIYRLSSQKYD